MLTKDFANTLRQKYPDGVASDGTPYSAMSDEELVGRVVQKYPTYKAQLEDFKGAEATDDLNPVEQFATDITTSIDERVANIKKAAVPETAEDAVKKVKEGQGKLALRVGGQIGGLVGDLEMSVVKLIAPKFAEDLAMKGVSKVAETDFAKGVAQKYEEFKTKHPEAVQDLEDAVNIAALIPYVKGAQVATKTAGKAIQKVSKVTGEALEASRVARIANATKEIDSVVGSIVQGSPDDILKAKKALSTINTTGVKTYQELGSRIDDGIEALSTKVDDALEAQSKNLSKTTGKAGVKQATSPAWIRYADDINKETYGSRGGTWYTNQKGAGVIEDAMDTSISRDVSIGGSKKFDFNYQPKKPLIIKDAILEDGSYAVINNGYENFIPKKYAKIADDLYTGAHRMMEEGVTLEDANKLDRFIMDSLFDAGIPEKQAQGVITKLKANKMDAAMDLIISKGLREKGYDALILQANDGAEHLFNLNLPKNVGGSSNLKINNLVTSTQVGNKTVKQNFVKDALDQLDELYVSIKDAPKRAEIVNIKNKLKTEGLTLKEVNDVSRLYGREFGSKAFSKIGDPLTSVNAQAFENTRKGIKNVVRNLMPDETVKMLDQRISDLYNTRRLVAKMEERVNALYQKVKKRGVLEQIAMKTADVANAVTMNTVSGFVSRLLPSNVGLKVMNSIDLEKALSGSLKKINGLLRTSNDSLLRDQVVKIIRENAAPGK